jgi:beta propeller repeat protein
MCFIALVAVITSGAIAPRAQSPALVVTSHETRLTFGSADHDDPAVSSNIVVFTDHHPSETDVSYVDVSTLTTHSAIAAPGNQASARVSSGRIVYADDRTADVMLFDIATATTTNLTAAAKVAVGHAFTANHPAISGDLVVWQDDRDGHPQIYGMNLVTGRERRISNSPDVDKLPVIDGNFVVWEREVASAGTSDLWGYEWITRSTIFILQTPTRSEHTPSISGTRVAYAVDNAGGSDVCVRDILTFVERCLVFSGDQVNPHISGDNITFDDTLPPGPSHIFLWHFATGDLFQLTPTTSRQSQNDIDGNRVVFTDDRNGHLDVYMVEFTVGPPSDTTPPLVVPHVTGRLGNNGWYVGAQTSVSWDISDPESDIASQVGCAPATLVLDTPGVTLTCTAINGASLQTSKSVTIKIDHTRPEITPPPDQTVTQRFPGGAFVRYAAPTIVETGSGLASARCLPASGTLFPVGTTTVTCTATDVAGNTSAAEFLVTVTPPRDRGMFGAGWIE